MRHPRFRPQAHGPASAGGEDGTSCLLSTRSIAELCPPPTPALHLFKKETRGAVRKQTLLDPDLAAVTRGSREPEFSQLLLREQRVGVGFRHAAVTNGVRTEPATTSSVMEGIYHILHILCPGDKQTSQGPSEMGEGGRRDVTEGDVTTEQGGRETWGEATLTARLLSRFPPLLSLQPPPPPPPRESQHGRNTATRGRNRRRRAPSPPNLVTRRLTHLLRQKSGSGWSGPGAGIPHVLSNLDPFNFLAFTPVHDFQPCDHDTCRSVARARSQSRPEGSRGRVGVTRASGATSSTSHALLWHQNPQKRLPKPRGLRPGPGVSEPASAFLTSAGGDERGCRWSWGPLYPTREGQEEAESPWRVSTRPLGCWAGFLPHDCAGACVRTAPPPASCQRQILTGEEAQGGQAPGMAAGRAVLLGGRAVGARPPCFQPQPPLPLPKAAPHGHSGQGVHISVTSTEREY
ncbi:hypothetical protein Cadr_000021569 [Camelus dromedarius]|uniref:Uncharacterized protein n=1 Tax=Camelus dromedarius TaxID=9838 RepID=A0A5N4CTJ0_CAMDR|nr:hypothetical protein Cadr_000021569 [Camelus dromedarius]